MQSLGKGIDMKRYIVQITDNALADMEEIYDYIAIRLQAPENALGQYNRIADAIEKLDVFPERVGVMESEPEHAIRGYQAKNEQFWLKIVEVMVYGQ